MARNSPHLLFIGDVGGPSDYHVGDEAMLAANLAGFRARVPGLRATVVSRDPCWTAQRLSAAAVPPLGFPDAVAGSVEDRRHRFEELLAGAGGAAATIAAVAAADGLVISGGGNLCASWPEHVCERAALAMFALRFGKPTVALGQTIGPALCAETEPLVAEMLRHAALVGVRELPSAALAFALGTPRDRLLCQTDDALSLAPVPLEDRESLALLERGAPWIAVTMDPHAPVELLDALPDQLARLAACCGARLMFVPHVAGAAGDAPVGHALAARLPATTPMHVWETMEAGQARWLAGLAELTVSTRYHPLVFGLAAGKPGVGIAVDEYRRVKLQGALGHAGLARFCLSLESALAGGVFDAGAELWRRRAELAGELATRNAAWRQAEEQRWRRTLAALGLAAPAPAAERQLLGVPLDELAPRLLGELELRRRGAELTVSRVARRSAEIERYALSLGKELEKQRPALAKEGSSAVISLEQMNDFARDGVLRLGPVLSARELEALRARADDFALGRVCNPAVQMQLDTGGAYERLPEAVERFERGTVLYRKIQGLETDDLYGPLVRHPLFLEVCGWLYGRHAAVSVFRAMVMNKPAGQGTELPWHQDGGDVWELDRDPLATIWVAIDPATRANGCMEIVRGSHRLGLLSARGSNLSAEDVQRHCPPERVEPLEVEPGHAVLLHNWLLHRSGVNPSATPRRAFTACYMDGRTRSTRTGQRFPRLAGTLGNEPDHYVKHLQAERNVWERTALGAKEYAESLAEESRTLRREWENLERYAKGLEAARQEQFGAEVRQAA